MRNIKKIKDHYKDIDFRTKQERQLCWERDFTYWLEDLDRHNEAEASKIQEPLLESIYLDLLNDPAGACAEIIATRNHYLGKQSLTEEEFHAFRLISVVCWYIE